MMKSDVDVGAQALLSVRDLQTQFAVDGRVYRAVDGVSFDVHSGEVVGVVGESGCGKSVTSLSIMRLIASPPGKIVSGQILFRGRDLLALSEREMQHVRGNDISMIFQEPMTALNPLMKLGEQVAETLQIHRNLNRKQARAAAIALLEKVRIPDAAMRCDEFPHQVSGGMRQRVMVAMALACRPALLIADEPTTALDVTVQAQILGLLDDLRTESGSAVLLITHDLGVVAQSCHRVIVMYAGQIVESATVHDLFANPRHPYTQGLLTAIPRMGIGTGKRLSCIEGSVPEPDKHPTGCRFHPRCKFAQPTCATTMPELTAAATNHEVRCALWETMQFENKEVGI